MATTRPRRRRRPGEGGRTWRMPVQDAQDYTVRVRRPAEAGGRMRRKAVVGRAFCAQAMSAIDDGRSRHGLLLERRRRPVLDGRPALRHGLRTSGTVDPHR